MIRTIEWLDPKTGHGTELRQDFEKIEDVAELIDLRVIDLEWALETYGRCDRKVFTVWRPETEDEEYPKAEAPVTYPYPKT